MTSHHHPRFSSGRHRMALAVVAMAIALALPSAARAVSPSYCNAWCYAEHAKCMSGYGSSNGEGGIAYCFSELTLCLDVCVRLVVATNGYAAVFADSDEAPSPLDESTRVRLTQELGRGSARYVGGLDGAVDHYKRGLDLMIRALATAQRQELSRDLVEHLATLVANGERLLAGLDGVTDRACFLLGSLGATEPAPEGPTPSAPSRLAGPVRLADPTLQGQVLTLVTRATRAYDRGDRRYDRGVQAVLDSADRVRVRLDDLVQQGALAPDAAQRFFALLDEGDEITASARALRACFAER